MINVLDRVPTRPGRMKLTHSDGTIEYVTLERADEPIESGTPINKALFDAIQSWALDITDRTEEYISPNVSNDGTNNYLSCDYPIEPYVLGRKLGLRIPIQYETQASTPMIPILSSDNDPGYVFSGTFSTPYKAFDGNTSTYATASGSTSSTKNDFIINFPKGKITGISLTYHYTPAMTFYGSEDGGNTWEQIGTTVSAKNQTTTSFTLDNKEYNALKLSMTGRYSSSYSTIYIHEISVTGYKNQFNPGYPTYINLSNQGNKLIDEDLSLEAIYSLYYDGTKFIIAQDRSPDTINDFISIKTGTISNSGTIPQTEGYRYYMYFVSVNSGGYSWSINTSVAGQSFNITTHIVCKVVQETRVVTCTVSGINSTANYWEIAWN